METNSNAETEKRRAAGSSVVAAMFLTSLKIVVGLLTGSLGILAEAAHSGLDLVAALVTFFAVRYSDQPPDAEHLYGHGKMEHLSALIETLLLLLTCAWIIYEAFQRLFFKSVEVDASIWAFVVMTTSVVVDVSRSRMLYRVARKHESQALEADALHFSTDIWSSLTVIAGLALVWLGERLGSNWSWLAKADAVAALVVALIVVYVSVELGKRATSALLDAAPSGLAERINDAVVQAPGVQSVGPLRVRQSGASTFVDLVVSVSRNASLQAAHRIAEDVENRVINLVPRGDVLVHVDPVQPSGESLPQAVKAIAGKLGQQIHDVRAYEVQGEYVVNLHVEMPAEMKLGQAYASVHDLEKALLDELPYVKKVNTHVEPLLPSVVAGPAPDAHGIERLRSQITALVEQIPELRECHDLHVWPAERDSYDVVLHCQADRDLTVAEAHLLANQVEKQLQFQIPGIRQVLVHVEPENDL